MPRKIKLIWDFRGPSAQETAKHHVVHLNEYAQIEKLSFESIETESVSDYFAMAFMIVNENDMLQIRDALKPHRGVVVQ